MSENTYSSTPTGKSYIYFYLDPFTWIPFYIGKGTGDRIRYHLKETKEKANNPRKWNKIQKIRKLGGEPIVIKWREGLSEQEAYDLEEIVICTFGRKDFEEDGCLTNLAVGGKQIMLGRRHSPESRKKMSEAKKGINLSEEHKMHIKNANLGKKRTEESRKRIRESQRLRGYTPLPKETLEKISRHTTEQWSRDWLLQREDTGETFTVHNLHRWCTEHYMVAPQLKWCSARNRFWKGFKILQMIPKKDTC